jgi:hypothetical protein
MGSSRSLITTSWLRRRAGGGRLDALAGRLGHAGVTTTGIYAQTVDKITENPARYLETVMGA